MKNSFRNTFLSVLVLVSVCLLARNFGGATTDTSTAPARHYYLTKGTINGNQALNACTSGYHFASYTELSDPAALSYNKSLGRSNPDDGAGPPAGGVGWVRSGWVSNSDDSGNFPTNCSLWTSGAGTDFGEIGIFDAHFVGVAADVAEPVYIFGDDGACDNSQGVNIGVWCVEN
jgi:hypothetical protein